MKNTDIKNLKISKKYAQALFEASNEADALDIIYNDLIFTEETIRTNIELSDFLASPIIKQEDKKDVINKLFKIHVNKITLDFLFLLIEADRIDIIKDVLNQFSTIYNSIKNIVKPIIKSAIELNEIQKNAIEVKLQSKLNKRVEPDYVVDSEIIGGLVIELDDKTIDCSLKNKFDNMQKHLVKGNRYGND